MSVLETSKPRSQSLNYAIGMFGTSIPINMLKTFAAIYYVDNLGMTAVQILLYPLRKQTGCIRCT